MTDPARLTASWQVEEVWQNGKRVNRSLILIDIDKNGGFRLDNDDRGDEQRGKLKEVDGQLRFFGDDGWIYDIHGRQRQLVVTARKGKKRKRGFVSGIAIAAMRCGQKKSSRKSSFKSAKSSKHRR